MQYLKHIVVAIMCFFSILNVANAQIAPVKWATAVEKLSDTEYNLIYKATIQDHWHLYSQTLPAGAAVPTEFIYSEDDLGKTFDLVDKKAKESKSITKFDKIFQQEMTFFDKSATFTQKIKLLQPATVINSEVSFQACDDEKCIFESEVLQFDLTGKKGGAPANTGVLEPAKWEARAKKVGDNEYEVTYTATIDKGWSLYSQFPASDALPLTTFTFKNKEGNYSTLGKTSEPEAKEKYDKIFEEKVKKFHDKAQFTQRFKVTKADLKAIPAEVEFMVCDDTKCLPPTVVEFNTPLDGSAEVKQIANIDGASKEKSSALDLGITGWDKHVKEDEVVEEKSNFTIFLLGFIGGLVALLTPCVFPMIPLTVSFFTKSATNSQKGLVNSIMYGVFIFLIYVLLSLPFHLLDSLDPEILNNISTNVTLNIVFFVIFIAFAFSFFGYYELTLPHSWSAKLDSKANSIGGFIGIFFMALTLAIVSFSCTGPILGTLLGSSLSSDGGAIQLTMGMAGFGLALALPFTLFAMFPKWLNAMPKSGGWLNAVKVVLGFIEIALAFKFLSNADLVEHWGLLKREVFIGIWIVVSILLALYLFGVIRFPHDGPKQKISVPKWGFIALVIAFIIYLIPGLSKDNDTANLKLLSGIAPPLPYSVYEKDSDCPLGLNCYKDLEEGIAAAKRENKPIMLDFTGWACVNCRKMEEHVWSKDKVFNLLNDKYVVISLYVDDRKKLPKEAQFQYQKPTGGIKNIKTVGDKWATLQTLNFKNNSQPYYALLNHNMELINHTNAYEPDVDAYYEWLKEGAENFKK